MWLVENLLGVPDPTVSTPRPMDNRGPVLLEMISVSCLKGEGVRCDGLVLA